MDRTKPQPGTWQGHRAVAALAPHRAWHHGNPTLKSPAFRPLGAGLTAETSLVQGLWESSGAHTAMVHTGLLGFSCSSFPHCMGWNSSKSLSPGSKMLWPRGCCCLVARLCPTLLQPHGLHSPSGSSFHGIFCARIIKWVAISFSRGSFQGRDWICVPASLSLQVDYLQWSHPHGGWGDVDKLLHTHFFAIILTSEITGCLWLLCCSLEFPWVTFISFKLFIFCCFCGRCKLWDLLLFHFIC